ncbi:hypothetical protein G6O67_000238 [Ophiocordyceps sinensis]|uniref:Prokaryotic-type class I peptide chain release factors domain-containing protein n=2 Tax=Ophiocordyceps sinensis TaxID=72228 RepID=A0A8H4PYQ2_9HYPO|nr:RF-1 domain-containing protein [Ophiocordyceps sinensis CO18]KAF4512909.1 hypothetical protein G6O67_000238 [Ophiocordyceps sinensis]
MLLRLRPRLSCFSFTLAHRLQTIPLALSAAGPSAVAAISTPTRRSLVSSPVFHAKELPPRPKPPPDSEIEEFFVRGSGPGGQKINKTSSAVQLRHVPTGIVVKSQATRSRSQNRKHARQILARRLDDLRHGDQSRAAAVGHVKKKRVDSAAKKSRRKYKKLDKDKASAAGPDHEPSQGSKEEVTPEQPGGTATLANEAPRRNQDKGP